MNSADQTFAMDRAATSRRRWVLSISGLAALMIWCSFLWMMVGPPLQLPFLPSEIQAHDLLAGAAILLGIALMARGQLYSSAFRSPVFFVFFLYVGAVLILPLLGLLFVPQAQLWMYFGDLRWLLILAMMVIAASIYTFQRRDIFERDVASIWVIAVVVTWAVLLPQVMLQVSGGSTPWIVDLWHPEGRTGRSHGFHIFRFAGPFENISGLATFGLVTFIAAMLSVDKSRLSLFVTISGLFFILASGSRTAMVLAGAFTLFHIFRPRTRFRLSAASLFRVVAFIAAFFGIYSVAMHFGVGRLGSGGGRLASIFGWLRGDVALVEIAGRGGDRWNLPIIESQFWSPIGTLVNAAHALDLPTFDSYYVLMWAQAGPFITLPFLLMIATALVFAFKHFGKSKSFMNGLAIAIIAVLPLFGLTQNIMTGLLGRSLLGLAVLIVFWGLARKSRNYLQAYGYQMKEVA
ncbi:MAG: hypothetical protein JJU27_17050 [Gammaproteobacteria bacterium]|nr:hypothetical protein [Gammaproteobacteria bacterium]